MPLIILIIVQIIFGINFSVSKYLLNYLFPAHWLFLRFFASSIIMFPLVYATNRFEDIKNYNFKTFIILFGLSLINITIPQYLFLNGLKFTSSTNASIITSLIPVFTLIIAVILKKELFTKNKLLGFFISFFGVLILQRVESFNISNKAIIGDLLVLLSVICFSFYLVLGKSFLEKHDHLLTTFFMFLFGSLTTFTSVDLKSFFIESPSFDLINFSSAVIFGVIGATLLCYFLSNWALLQVSSSMVSFFIYLQPVVATIIGFYVLNESITQRHILSIFMIILGMIIVVFPSLRRKN